MICILCIPLFLLLFGVSMCEVLELVASFSTDEETDVSVLVQRRLSSRRRFRRARLATEPFRHRDRRC
jgi:hypothetical protein